MPHHGNPRNNKPSKSWCYTLNNPSQEDEDTIRIWDVTRQIYGHEVGESGTPHLQGFVVFRRASRLTAVKKLLPRAHWEIAKATDAAWNYCTKGSDIWTCDNRRQGARTDLIDFAEAIQSGTNDADLLREHPSCFLKYQPGLRAARKAISIPRSTWTECEWWYGPTASGKSGALMSEYPGAAWVTITKSGFFFGYQGESVVILDDPDLDAIPRELFLNMVNKTPFRIAVKGSDLMWNPKKVIVSSNFPPDTFHCGVPEVHRRILKVFKFLPFSPRFCEKNITDE